MSSILFRCYKRNVSRNQKSTTESSALIQWYIFDYLLYRTRSFETTTKAIIVQVIFSVIKQKLKDTCIRLFSSKLDPRRSVQMGHWGWALWWNSPGVSKVSRGLCHTGPWEHVIKWRALIGLSRPPNVAIYDFKSFMCTSESSAQELLATFLSLSNHFIEIRSPFINQLWAIHSFWFRKIE